MARPRQPILSRGLIITTALDLIDRTGRFTIPELAHRLQVSVSSLYHHVAGRADIVEGIRGRLVALMTMPTEPDWQDAVVHWATSYRDAFAAHPAAIPLLVGQTVSDPVTLSQYDVAQCTTASCQSGSVGAVICATSRPRMPSTMSALPPTWW